jgi:predicted secreted protein
MSRSHAETFLVYPLPPARPKMVRAVRSTLVTSGLVALRERGLYERYAANLAPTHLETVRGLVAGTWLPAELMGAHYAAWDALGLSAEDVRVIGTNIAARVGENMLLAIKNLTAIAGVTPWDALAQYGRLWTRAFDGGGIRIERAGPKDATLHFSEVPFARSNYFQGSLVAIHDQALGMFAGKMYTRVLMGSTHDTGFSMRMAWV